MSYRGIDRLHPTDKASFGRHKSGLYCDQGPIDVVLTLGDERLIQSRDTLVVAMIDGAPMFGRTIDGMPVNDCPSRI